MEKTFDTEKALEAQREYCKKNGFPMFAPADGICFRCSRNIYEKISVESAGAGLKTGCPHCNYSFVS